MAEVNPYAEVLASLMKRHSELERELVSVANAVRALTALPDIYGQPEVQPQTTSNSEISDTVSYSNRLTPSTTSNVGRYAGISMRWSCLWILAQSPGGLSTTEISDHLISGGKTSTASNYSSNVSAVLSGMKSRGEVDLDNGFWTLTLVGRQAWNSIKPKIGIS